MSLPTKQKTEQTCGCQEGGVVGEEWIGSLELAAQSVIYMYS